MQSPCKASNNVHKCAQEMGKDMWRGVVHFESNIQLSLLIHVLNKGLVEAARGSTKECSEEAQCYCLGRDFSGAVCPGGFITASPGDRWSCRATSDYEGPCSNELVSFDGFTTRALEAWSQQCDAYWPCLDLTARDFEAEVATSLVAGVHRTQVVYRLKQGLESIVAKSAFKLRKTKFRFDCVTVALQNSSRLHVVVVDNRVMVYASIEHLRVGVTRCRVKGISPRVSFQKVRRRCFYSFEKRWMPYSQAAFKLAQCVRSRKLFEKQYRLFLFSKTQTPTTLSVQV